jgi:hypothetical protein
MLITLGRGSAPRGGGEWNRRGWRAVDAVDGIGHLRLSGVAVRDRRASIDASAAGTVVDGLPGERRVERS